MTTIAIVRSRGTYSVRLTLEDADQDLRVEEPAIPLVVETPPEPDVVEGVVPGLTEVLQDVQDGRVPLPVGLAILVGSLLAGIVIGWLILVLRRRRRARASGR